MIDAIGAPGALTSLLVPVRESESMIPQLVIAAFVRRRPTQKWVWVAGDLLQALAVLAMGLVAWFFEGVAARVAVVAAVTAKDVLGKTIPKTRRARVNGVSASTAGLATLGVGSALVAVGADDGDPVTFFILLAAAAVLWVAAASTYARIVEWPGEPEGGGNALAQATAKLALLRDDPPYRSFVIARARRCRRSTTSFSPAGTTAESPVSWGSSALQGGWHRLLPECT